MSSIKVNDIFDELFDENKRLLNELLVSNKCLNVLIRFKTQLIDIYIKFKSHLNLNEIQMFEELENECKEVLNGKTLNLDLNENKSLIVSKTNELINENINQFKCDFTDCMKRFKSKQSLGLHKRDHIINQKSVSNQSNGSDNKNKTKDNNNNEKNGPKESKQHKCKVDSCGKSYKYERSLRLHRKTIHKISENVFYCYYYNCRKGFKTEEYLRHHLSKHEPPTNGSVEYYQCQFPDCHYKTTHPYRRRTHELTHSTERPFSCDINGCVQTFRIKSLLKSHQNNCHNNTGQQFKCDFNGCRKVCKNIRLLKMHSVMHSDVRPLACVWPGCGFTTKRAKTLKNHQLVHKTDGEFGCDWPECGKRFKLKDRLTQHMRIHTNDKRHACAWPGCLYRCVDSGNLRKHMKIHQKV